MGVPINPNLPLFTAKGATLTIDNLPQVTAISVSITKSNQPDGSTKYNVTAVLDIPLSEQWKTIQGQTVPVMQVLGEGNSRKLSQVTFLYDAGTNTLYCEALTIE